MVCKVSILGIIIISYIHRKSIKGPVVMICGCKSGMTMGRPFVISKASRFFTFPFFLTFFNRRLLQLLFLKGGEVLRV